MDRGTDAGSGSGDAPADLFELLGEETRMAILRALVAADRETEERTLAFVELQDRAGVEDTGRFNYHLGKLRGTLVTDTGSGYRLSAFGRRVLRPMATGFYDPDLAVETLAVPGTCPDCGAGLRVRPVEGVLQVRCGGADEHVLNHGLVASPGLLARHSAADARTALGLLATHAVELGTAGVCPVCHGHTEGGLEQLPERDSHVYRAPCEDCGNDFMTTVGGCVGTHPEVVALYAANDVDIRRTVPWRHPFRRPGAEEVVRTAPLRVGVRVGTDLPEGSLYVTVDRSGTVTSLQEVPP